MVAARNATTYYAAKHAVACLTRAARGCAMAGLRVIAVRPGCTRTPILSRVFVGDPEVAPFRIA